MRGARVEVKEVTAFWQKLRPSAVSHELKQVARGLQGGGGFFSFPRRFFSCTSQLSNSLMSHVRVQQGVRDAIYGAKSFQNPGPAPLLQSRYNRTRLPRRRHVEVCS